MRHLASLLFMTCLVTGMAQVPNYVPTDGLIAWWPFNGNANDESGNGNHGTMNNAVLTVDRYGNAGSAYSFNGINQLIAGNISGVSNTSATTVTAWVRYVGNAGGSPYDTFFKFGALGTHTFAYGYNYGDQGLNLYSLCITGTYSFPSVNLNNAWHFVAVVDSDTETKTYVDGVLLSLLPGGPTDNCYQGTSTFTIGASQVDDNQWVTGDLDDIGFWNRALTPTEIEALYNGEAPPPCVSVGSIALSGLNTSYQTTDPPSVLVGTPDGGVFFGPGVTDTEFDPAAAGPGTHTVVYTYIDQNGCVNSTGLCTTVSTGMGVNDSNRMLNGVHVYPNPADGIFTLELELQGLVTLTVHDSRGRQVLNQTFMAQGARTTRLIDLSREAAGAYMLCVGTQAGSATQRLIRQ